MSEKKLVIDCLEMHYEGLFDVNELLKAFDGLLAQRGYEKREKRRSEIVTTTGKEFSMELRPTKRKTDFFELMINIRINITNMTDAEIMQDKRKRRLNQGVISIVFDAWTTTDYEFRWEEKPWFYFLRSFFEKGIYKVHTSKYVGELMDDTHFIYNNIKSHLNLHRFV